MVIFLKYASEPKETNIATRVAIHQIHHPLQLVVSHHCGAQANLVSNEDLRRPVVLRTHEVGPINLLGGLLRRPVSPPLRRRLSDCAG